MFSKLIRFILISISLSSFAHSSDTWKIEESGDDYKIEKGELKATIERGSVVPKFIEKKSYGHFDVYIFMTDSYGTSSMIEEQSGLVFNQKTNAFLGSYPFRYISLSQAVKTGEISQPVWEFKNNQLKINDKDNFVEATIK